MPAPIFTITHGFDAPRDVVWKAWTEPTSFARWFGPKGCTASVKTLDLRPGGVLHSCLTLPDGNEMWAKFVYRDVRPPELLAWEHSFSDKDGNITTHPLKPDWPLKLLTTVRFEDQNGATNITLTWQPLDATDVQKKSFESQLSGMEQGWGGTFEQLADFLAKAKAA